MASEADQLFCQIAVERLIIDGTQAASLLKRRTTGKGIMRPLHEQLVEDGILTAEQAKEIVLERDFRKLRQSDQKWGEKAVRDKTATGDAVLAALAAQRRLYDEERRLPPSIAVLLRTGLPARREKKIDAGAAAAMPAPPPPAAAGAPAPGAPPVTAPPKPPDEETTEPAPFSLLEQNFPELHQHGPPNPLAREAPAPPGPPAGAAPAAAPAKPREQRRATSWLNPAILRGRSLVDRLAALLRVPALAVELVVLALLVGALAWVGVAAWRRMEGARHPGAGPKPAVAEDRPQLPPLQASHPRPEPAIEAPCVVVTFPSQEHPLAPYLLSNSLEPVMVVHLSPDKLEPVMVEFDLRVLRSCIDPGPPAGSAPRELDLRAGEWCGRRESYDRDPRLNCRVTEEEEGKKKRRFWLSNWLRSRSTRTDEFGRPLEIWATCAVLTSESRPADEVEAAGCDYASLQELRIDPVAQKAWLTERGAGETLVRREGKAVFHWGERVEERWSPERIEAARRRKERQGQVDYLVEAADAMTKAGDLEGALNRLAEAEALAEDAGAVRAAKGRIEEARKAREAAARQAQAAALRKEARERVDKARALFREGKAAEARGLLGNSSEEFAEVVREDRVLAALKAGWDALRAGDTPAASYNFFTASSVESEPQSEYHREAELGKVAVSQPAMLDWGLVLVEVHDRPLAWKGAIVKASNELGQAWGMAMGESGGVALIARVDACRDALAALTGSGPSGEGVLAVRGAANFLKAWAHGRMAESALEVERVGGRLPPGLSSSVVHAGHAADAAALAAGDLAELRRIVGDNHAVARILVTLNVLIVARGDRSAAVEAVEHALAAVPPTTSLEHQLHDFARREAQRRRR